MAPLRVLRRRLLGIGVRETDFDVRGFHVSSTAAREVLETHGRSFVDGYNAALLGRDADEFASFARGVELEERGFAYEGAAMALALLDLFTFGLGGRLRALLEGPGRAHVYMVHVGAGWALARLRRRPWGGLRGLDPLLRWLALDGFGFHEGFFAPERHVRRQAAPRLPRGYARRVFDQGLGRSLWFLDGADPERIASTVDAFPPDRRPDLWSGVGLAAAYAGAIDRDGIVHLSELAHDHLPHLAQGAAFAATARLRAGNVVPHTVAACEVLCGRGIEAAAALVDEALDGVTSDGAGAAYERWRSQIRTALQPAGAVRA